MKELRDFFVRVKDTHVSDKEDEQKRFSEMADKAVENFDKAVTKILLRKFNG